VRIQTCQGLAGKACIGYIGTERLALTLIEC